MPSDSSKIREKAIELFRGMDKLSVKHIKHSSLKYLYEKFVRPHIESLVKFQIPEIELKTSMIEAYYVIKPIVEDFTIAHEVKESMKLNSPEMTKKLMQLPNFKDLEDLLDGM